jgi:hypothetical protein
MNRAFGEVIVFGDKTRAESATLFPVTMTAVVTNLEEAANIATEFIYSAEYLSPHQKLLTFCIQVLIMYQAKSHIFYKKLSREKRAQ